MIDAQGRKSGDWLNCRALTTGLTSAHRERPWWREALWGIWTQQRNYAGLCLFGDLTYAPMGAWQVG